MPAGRCRVNLGVREIRLSRAKRIDELHPLFDVHVGIVIGDVHEQRNLQPIDLEERRSLSVDRGLFVGQASEPVLRIDQSTLTIDAFPCEPMEEIGEGTLATAALNNVCGRKIESSESIPP